MAVLGPVAFLSGHVAPCPNRPAVQVPVRLRQYGLSVLSGQLAKLPALGRELTAQALEELPQVRAAEELGPAQPVDGFAKLRAALGADIDALARAPRTAARLQVQPPERPPVAAPVAYHAGPLRQNRLGVVSQNPGQPLPPRRGQIAEAFFADLPEAVRAHSGPPAVACSR